MGEALELELDLQDEPLDGDNITDWCLEQFRDRYGDHITKDDIWEYLYGVMHAPDWRERYKHDLQRNLPRVPLAPDFEAFRAAGRELMDIHAYYETCPEHMEVVCEVDGQPDNDGAHPDPEVYRIKKLRWAKERDGNGDLVDDDSCLLINDRVRLTGIPPEAHDYTVSGRSPLRWAIDSLRHKNDKDSGITDDPNGWHEWADEPFNLVRHLRRLIWLSIRSAEITAGLPPSLPDISETAQKG